MRKKCTILLIGGTGEAARLNEALFALETVQLITSLAGRTKEPSKLKGEVVAGGFSAIGGLEQFLTDRKVDRVIDASHPFADEISRRANQICQKMGIAYLRFDRKPWKKTSDDVWIDAADAQDAAGKLGDFQRIFMSIGRQELTAFSKLSGKTFIIRSIESIDFSPAHSEALHIRAKGPFLEADESALMTGYKIDAIVSKNSGGEATFAKIVAARLLSLPVIMIRRPLYNPSDVVDDLGDLLAKVKLSF